MSNDEKIFVYIEKRNNEICGYTYDYTLGDPSSYCKAVFKGWYDGDDELWVLMGDHFMENSGSHILMILRLWQEKGDGPNRLRGTVETKANANSLFNMGGGRGSIKLVKTSSTLPRDMPECFPKIKKPGPNTVKKEAIIKPLPKNIKPGVVKQTPTKPPAISSKPPVALATPKAKKPPVTAPAPKPSAVKSKPQVKTEPLAKPKLDTAQKKAVPISKAPPKTATEVAAVNEMKARKKTQFSHLVIHDKTITLKMYDNGTVDNDTVSVFYNGRLVAGKKRLSETPIVIQLNIDEDRTDHEIVMFAENLGTISPNTALIVVTTSDQRYELHSSASLTENAVLTFEYKPN